jgi:hypothetical protein
MDRAGPANARPALSAGDALALPVAGRTAFAFISLGRDASTSCDAGDNMLGDCARSGEDVTGSLVTYEACSAHWRCGGSSVAAATTVSVERLLTPAGWVFDRPPI